MSPEEYELLWLCRNCNAGELYCAVSTPTEEQAMEIIERAEVVIDKVASYIRNGEEFPQAKISIGDRMSSGIINDLFYPLFVHAKKFLCNQYLHFLWKVS